MVMMMKLKLNGWDQHIGFSACHVIPNHDKCGRLHGHSYGVHMEIEGQPDEEGEVEDFSIVKAHLRELTEMLDHRVIIPLGDPEIQVDRYEDHIEITVRSPASGTDTGGAKRYILPTEDVILLDISRSSAEMLAAYIAREMELRLTGQGIISAISVGVDEGPGQGAWFRIDME